MQSCNIVRVPSVLTKVHTMTYCRRCFKSPVQASPSKHQFVCQCPQEQETMKLCLYRHNVPTVNGHPERDQDCVACQMVRRPQLSFDEMHICEKQLHRSQSERGVDAQEIDYFIEMSLEEIQVQCGCCRKAFPRASFKLHMCIEQDYQHCT